MPKPPSSPEQRTLVEQKREALRQGIVEIADLVETALQGSLTALRRRDLDLARDIIAGDALINRKRRVLEQQALVVLAAHQPAGGDLRLIGASLEMIGEIERIADHAADVAHILLEHAGDELPDALAAKVVELGEAAAGMFQGVMQVYAQGADAEAARASVAAEDAVDAQERQIIQEVTAWLCQSPQSSTIGLGLLWIAHHYERVADRVTNIAERTVYIATGETPDLD